MNQFAVLVFILTLSRSSAFGQIYPDQIVLKTGAIITCKITLVNDQNIFYTHQEKRKINYDYISIYEVNNYNWVSKDKAEVTKKDSPIVLNDSTPAWKAGIKLTQHINYPILHTTPSISIYLKNNNFYIGPEYTKFLKQPSGDPVDMWEKDYWGLNFGYRRKFISTLKSTQMFVQINFSIYEVSYIEFQKGPPYSTNHKRTIVENSGGLGINQRVFKQVEIYAGIGIGSTNGFFLMFDSFIPHSFIGIEYIIAQ